MTDPTPAKPVGPRPNRRAIFLLVGVSLVIVTPVLGYYVSSYYSATRVMVDIVSGTRALANPINYTLLIRITVPGSIMSVMLWPPTVTLLLDSFNLGGVFPCQPSPDFWEHLSPGDALTCRGYWQSSFADHPGQPSQRRPSTRRTLTNLSYRCTFTR